MFDRSLVMRLRYRPWRWTVPPTFNPDGSVATPGTSQTLSGVFILLSDELIDLLAATLTQAQKDELRGWIYRVTEEQAAEWNVPVWAGRSSAVYLRVPATVWNAPDGDPPAKVKTYFQHLWREAT